MRIIVIDGQGGGLGADLIARLKARLSPEAQVWAVGANALATSAMLKAGADKAATGENAVCWNAANADLIMGPIGLLSANSLMGEISPRMAAAISESSAKRILIPLSSCGVLVAGVGSRKMDELLEDAVSMAVREVTK